jgi:hypothetical protein
LNGWADGVEIWITSRFSDAHIFRFLVPVLHGIDWDSKENGVWLPNRKNTDGMGGILHNGRHPKEYFKTVNDRIKAADIRGGKDGRSTPTTWAHRRK